MRIATKSAAVLAVVLCLLPIGTANAQLEPEPVSGFAGFEFVGPNLVANKDHGNQATAAITVVYDNMSSAANFGFSSTDPAARFGDELLTIGNGLLSGLQFTVFNSGSSLGPLLTANIGLDLYDAATAAPLGSFSVSVNFGAGLNPGFFSIVNTFGLDPLLINLGVTDVLVVQRIISKTGTANRLGIVSLDPPTVGTSPVYMFIQASTVAGGAPGYYTIATGPANPGYQLSLAQPPVGTTASTWGRVKRLYR